MYSSEVTLLFLLLPEVSTKPPDIPELSMRAVRFTETLLGLKISGSTNSEIHTSKDKEDSLLHLRFKMQTQESPNVEKKGIEKSQKCGKII